MASTVMSSLCLLFLPLGHAFVAAPSIIQRSVSASRTVRKKTRVNYHYSGDVDDEMEYWHYLQRNYWEEQHHRQQQQEEEARAVREYLQVQREFSSDLNPRSGVIGGWEVDLADMERQWIELEQLNQNIIEPMLLPQTHPHHHRRLRSPLPGLVRRPIPIRMLRTNADFPTRNMPSSQWSHWARDPVPFDDATTTPSQRISANILIPCEGSRNKSSNSEDEDQQPYVILDDGKKFIIQTVIDDVLIPQQQQKQGDDNRDDDNHVQQQQQRAYWLQSQISTAIHGQVRVGTILRKLKDPIQVNMHSSSSSSTDTNHDNEKDESSPPEEWTLIEWEATNERCAVKELNWDHIFNQGQVLAEDPIKEVAAMQYMQKWTSSSLAAAKTTTAASSASAVTNDDKNDAAMNDTHILLALDILADDQHLYNIMPYCEGGRLLDRIESKNRFSESEARHWMRQILTGLACLKEAGVSHKDVSPENLLLRDGKIFIIDMGMSLRVPFVNDRTNERSLILPQGVCGKWYYLSPEVCANEQPFDGPTVDLWAAGVILFMMLTGEPPWSEPKMTDANFRHISAGGNLMRILTERRAGLSMDAMDLLQQMLWVDPLDRLSLEQVWSHPWMCVTQQ